MEQIIKCNVCNQLFDEDEFLEVHEKGTYESDYGVSDLFDSHTHYDYVKQVCPYCRCDDYRRGYICRACGEFVEVFGDDEKELCYECFDKEPTETTEV